MDLKKKQVLSSKLEILLPEDFEQMEQAWVEVAYPIATKRPKEVYANREGNITIGFNQTEDELRADQLEDLLEILKMQFNRPSIKTECQHIEPINGWYFIVLKFILPTEFEPLYNALYITGLERKMLNIAFNCTIEHLPVWKPLFEQMAQSLHILPPEDHIVISIAGANKQQEPQPQLIEQEEEEEEDDDFEIIIRPKF